MTTENPYVGTKSGKRTLYQEADPHEQPVCKECKPLGKRAWVLTIYLGKKHGWQMACTHYAAYLQRHDEAPPEPYYPRYDLETWTEQEVLDDLDLQIEALEAARERWAKDMRGED